MSEIQISSTGWLAISLRNGTASVFDLNDICSWQYLQNQSNDEDTNDLNHPLIKFSPNGQILVFNGQKKQLYVYIQSDFEKTEVWWELQRIIVVKNQISSLDLTNEFLFLADIEGDVYQIDLSFHDQNLIVSAENCIMKNISIILDITFLRINEKKSFLITADQDNRIRLNHYPNTSQIEGYCLGHTEFISHIKLIDNNYIFSASGDGTIRLWRLPDCVPLVLLHSKAFSLLSKQIFYTQLFNPENFLFIENYRTDAMPQESSLNSSSILDYSIWKMDVISYTSNIYIAFSIYAHRFHSIYLTSLKNIKQLANQQRKVTFDISYGTIVDYCLLNDYLENSNCCLYILFNSNILIKVNIMSILLCNQTELFAESNETIQEINNILTRKEFQLTDFSNNDLTFNEMIYNKLSKNDNSCLKRKTEISEQQQRKKPASLQDEEDTASIESW
jgi:WD40 repeat protein